MICQDKKAIAKELNELLDLPFHQKLMLSRLSIQKALRNHENVFVACSFGKDSIVLLHMVITIQNVPVIFCNTGIEFKENIELKFGLTEQWGLVVYEVKPSTTYWQICENFGYPKESRGKTHGTPYCCYYLKEKPTKKLISWFDKPLIFVGITGDEGYARRWAYILKEDDYYYSKSWKCHKSIPLIFWTKQDINEYIKRYDLPVSEAYEKYDLERTGCMWCTGHKNWQQQILRINPRVYEKIQKDMGQTVLTGG